MIICLLVIALSTPVYTGYLKSAGNIKILENEELKIDWIAYNDEERDLPCIWSHAPDRSTKLLLFLACQDGRRHMDGDQGQWRFLNETQPCASGIQKKAKLKDAGVYIMVTEKGTLKKEEDGYTEVKVYKRNELNFSVTVNGDVRNLDLSKGSNLTLDLLETDQPVNVTVRLAETFQPSTVNMKSIINQTTCHKPFQRCDLITEIKERAKISVVSEIQTEIIGADPVIISQPVTYLPSPAYKNRKSAAIVFGVLGIALLLIIIFVIIYLIRINRPHNMNDVEARKDLPKKHSSSQPFMNRVQNAASSLSAAFRVKDQTVHHEIEKMLRLQNQEIRTLKKACRKNYKLYIQNMNKHMKIIKTTSSSAEECIKKCKEVNEDLQQIENMRQESSTYANDVNLKEKIKHYSRINDLRKSQVESIHNELDTSKGKISDDNLEITGDYNKLIADQELTKKQCDKKEVEPQPGEGTAPLMQITDHQGTETADDAAAGSNSDYLEEAVEAINYSTTPQDATLKDIQAQHEEILKLKKLEIKLKYISSKLEMITEYAKDAQPVLDTFAESTADLENTCSELRNKMQQEIEQKKEEIERKKKEMKSMKNKEDKNQKEKEIKKDEEDLNKLKKSKFEKEKKKKIKQKEEEIDQKREQIKQSENELKELKKSESKTLKEEEIKQKKKEIEQSEKELKELKKSKFEDQKGEEIEQSEKEPKELKKTKFEDQKGEEIEQSEKEPEQSEKELETPV